MKALLALLLVPAIASACPGWNVKRTIDPMTDQAKCLITSPDSKLGVGVQGQAVSFAVSDGLSGRSFTVRIDDHPPHLITLRGTSTESFESDARDLLADLQAGTTIRTQHLAWPSGSQVNSQALVCDLPALIADCSN